MSESEKIAQQQFNCCLHLRARPSTNVLLLLSHCRAKKNHVDPGRPNSQEETFPSEAPEGEVVPSERANAERAHVGSQPHHQRTVTLSHPRAAPTGSLPRKFQNQSR